MKRFISCIIVMLTLCVNNSIAQSFVVKGKQFVATSQSNEGHGYTKTEYVWTVDKKDYPIYISNKTGSCFIFKTSKNTGKEYRQYLGAEVSKEVCKRMKREYKPKSNKD